MTIKLAVIGAGPAGYPAALKAAALGAEVTVIEKAKAGGVCLNCGCIPSKSLLDAAHRFDVVRSIASLCTPEAAPAAQTVAQHLSWSAIQARQQAVTTRLSAGILALFRAKKINYITGEASFANPHELTVTTEGKTQNLTFDYIIIAAGSEAFLPPPFDRFKSDVHDNSTIFSIAQLPREMVIVGGGVIGCEFATLMSSLGVKVSVIEMQPSILPAEDPAAAQLLAKTLTARGVALLTGKQVTDMSVENGRKKLVLNDGQTLETDLVLAAIGRSVNLTALKPENAGVEWTRKGVKVNPQTLQLKDHIYAAGDITGLSLLAHAATRQGQVAAANICGQNATYNNAQIPSAIYTHPEIASIGENKKSLTEKGAEFVTHKAFFMASGRALTQDAKDGFIEIYSAKSDDKILGALMIGPQASEVIHALCVALQAQMTTAQLREVVFAHPTISESIADALGQ